MTTLHTLFAHSLDTMLILAKSVRFKKNIISKMMSSGINGDSHGSINKTSFAFAFALAVVLVVVAVVVVALSLVNEEEEEDDDDDDDEEEAFL